jgi:hypothetical protein
MTAGRFHYQRTGSGNECGHLGCISGTRDCAIDDHRRDLVLGMEGEFDSLLGPACDGMLTYCLLLRLRTMQEEAFEIWTEWSRLYPLRSASRQLLQQISEESWLVSLIHHDYKDTEALWRFLMQE